MSGEEDEVVVGALAPPQASLPRLPRPQVAYCTLLTCEVARASSCVAHGLALVRLHVAARWSDLPDDARLKEEVQRYCAAFPAGVKGILVYEALEVFDLCAEVALEGSPTARVAPRILAAWLRGKVGSTLGVLSSGRPVTFGEYVADACRRHCSPGVQEVYRWHAAARDCDAIVHGERQFWFVALGDGKGVGHAADEQRDAEHLFSRDLLCICKPPVRYLREARAAMTGLADFTLPAGLGAEAQAGRAEPVSVTFPATRHQEIRRGVQSFKYALWFHVDCALLSRNLRDMRNVQNVTRDVLVALLGDVGEPVFEGLVQNGFRWPSRGQVAQDRIRLDFACMLYQRELFRGALRDVAASQRTFREVLFDGSRAFGREALAIRENKLVFTDFNEPPQVSSVRFPTVCVGHGQMTAADKGHAVLHAAFLVRGPGKRELEQWAQSVRCVPTDLGVETMLCNAANVLPAFYHTVAKARDQPFLFPLALRIPGWQHICHNIVEDTVAQTMRWFPSFIADFREVQAFVRTREYMDILRRILRDRGRDELLQATGRYTERFVESRWGSLVESCRRLLAWRLPLQAGWDGALFHVKGKMLDIVQKVSGDGEYAVEFWQRCAFLAAVFEILESLRQWGAGCSCHDDQRRAGRPVSCHLAGRRLEAAWPRVVEAQAALRALAEGRHGNADLAPTPELAQNAFEAIFCQSGILQLKMAYLDRLPYSLVRLGSPGLAARVLAEFDAQEAEGLTPHRVATHFLGRDTLLRAQVEALAGGSAAGPELVQELVPLRWGLMSEAAVEGEHHDLAHERRRSHATRHAQAVATLRMDQNRPAILSARTDAAKRKVFEACWRSWKLVADSPRVGFVRHRIRDPGFHSNRDGIIGSWLFSAFLMGLD